MFAVTRVEGNSRTVLAKFRNRDDALEKARSIFDSSSEKVMISVIEADFDEEDRMINNRYKLYRSWF